MLNIWLNSSKSNPPWIVTSAEDTCNSKINKEVNSRYKNRGKSLAAKTKWTELITIQCCTEREQIGKRQVGKKRTPITNDALKACDDIQLTWGQTATHTRPLWSLLTTIYSHGPSSTIILLLLLTRFDIFAHLFPRFHLNIRLGTTQVERGCGLSSLEWAWWVFTLLGILLFG